MSDIFVGFEVYLYKYTYNKLERKIKLIKSTKIHFTIIELVTTLWLFIYSILNFQLLSLFLLHLQHLALLLLRFRPAVVLVVRITRHAGE